MSVVTNLRWAREQRTGDWVAKAVLMVIASHTDRDGIAMLSYRTIADELERNEATVRRHMPLLINAGLVEQHIAKGRGKTRYRLLVDRLVRRPEAAQDTASSAAPGAAQADLFSEAPERRTSDGVGEPPEDRSAAQPSRSAARHVSDQQQQTTEVEAEVSTRGAPPSPPARGARERASARGGGSPSVPASELNRLATRGPAYRVVNDWAAAQPPGFRIGAKRELNKAVEALLATQSVDPDLIHEALDEAHRNPRFKIPAQCLTWAYDEVWRRHHAPAREPTRSRGDQKIQDFLGYDPFSTTRAIGGA